MFSVTGISPYPKKGEIIYKTNPPTIIAGVRSLMGIIMYCVNLNFSEVYQPLNELTKKNVQFQWTQQQDDSFKKIKTKP